MVNRLSYQRRQTKSLRSVAAAGIERIGKSLVGAVAFTGAFNISIKEFKVADHL